MIGLHHELADQTKPDLRPRDDTCCSISVNILAQARKMNANVDCQRWFDKTTYLQEFFWLTDNPALNPVEVMFVNLLFYFLFHN